jgi:uncharacterized protein YndB with AHSA1/START domain
VTLTIDVQQDTDALTTTLVAEFDAPVDAVWQVWADPRKLERWWGPPTHPATVTEHSLELGAYVRYYMTGPEGERFPGLWQVLEVEPPHHLRFQDKFTDADGEPVDDMPSTVGTVTLAPRGDATVMTIESSYPSREDMDKLLAMGMLEGIQSAVAQIADILS